MMKRRSKGSPAGTGKLHHMGDMTADVIGLDWSTEIREARRILGPGVRCVYTHTVDIAVSQNKGQSVCGLHCIKRDHGIPADYFTSSRRCVC